MISHAFFRWRSCKTSRIVIIVVLESSYWQIFLDGGLARHLQYEYMKIRKQSSRVVLVAYNVVSRRATFVRMQHLDGGLDRHGVHTGRQSRNESCVFNRFLGKLQHTVALWGSRFGGIFASKFPSQNG